MRKRRIPVSRRLIRGLEMSAILVLLRTANVWPMRYIGIDVISLHHNPCRLAGPVTLPPAPVEAVRLRRPSVGRPGSECRGGASQGSADTGCAGNRGIGDFQSISIINSRSIQRRSFRNNFNALNVEFIASKFAFIAASNMIYLCCISSTKAMVSADNQAAPYEAWVNYDNLFIDPGSQNQ